VLASSRHVSAADRARLDLADDRVLAAVVLDDGRRAVATRRALFLLDEDSVDRGLWCDVDRGSLDPETRALTVHWVSGAADRLVLGTQRASVAFAQTFRERVQQSVVHAVTVTTPDGRSLRVALRRDEEGALFTQVVGEDAVDLSDPAVLAVVERAEADLREAVGLRR
jgi:hypothetical protein